MPFKIKSALACRGYYDIMVNGQSIYRGTKAECTTQAQLMIVDQTLQDPRSTKA